MLAPMLAFGVTVLPDPPYQRLIELTKLAEAQGFEYGWTYDSHVLWQESMPVMALLADQTSTIKLGHMVTNPAIRDPTVLASAYATLQDISNGRMIMGVGRGDSSVRYVGRKPMRVADFEEALKMVKPFMNGKEVTWNDKQLQLKWVRPELPEIEMHVAGYGPKALAVAGRQGDGVIIQLADPDIIQWIMDTARQAAEEAGRDPAALKCIVSAPSHISADLADAREQVRWFPAMVSNHVQDLIDRYGTDGSVVPQVLTDYVAGAEVLRLQRALPRRRQARRVRHRRDLRPLLRPRHGRAGDREAARARGDRRRPVQHLPDDARSGGDARDLRARHPAAVQRGGGVEATDEVRRRWDAAAVGWEAEREAVTAFGAPVAEALVAGLAISPGKTVLDLAAGTGDVTEALAQGGAHVISTDISPVMVEAARRRGIPDVEHRVMDMQAIDLPDSSVDGVVSRYGYMLVPDPALALRETRRVLKPGGRLAFATWAPAKRNPWATAYGPVLVERGLLEPPKPDEPGQFFLGEPARIEELVRGCRVRRARGERGTGRLPGRELGGVPPDRLVARGVDAGGARRARRRRACRGGRGRQGSHRAVSLR